MGNSFDTYSKLIKKANMYARQYYYIGRSDISDADYDKIIAKITMYENNCGFSSDDSPTTRVGWHESTDKDFKHKYQKCLSLDNIRTSAELSSFLTNEAIAMPKLDGCSVMVYYEDGMMTNVVTRGDGVVGKDITHLWSYIDGIPAQISTKDPIRVEGEVLSDNFDTSKGKNQRNFVAGSLGLKEATDAVDRGLYLTAYNIVYKYDTNRPASFLEILHLLLKEEFNRVDYVNAADFTPDEIKVLFAKTNRYTDGVVYKFANTDSWTEFTRHHPKFAIAYKFPEKEYQTKLIGVQWQVGKHKQLTPVGILEPVDIEGVTVSRASLANLMNIKARGIKLLDTVNVIRAGAVIPQIVSVYQEDPDRADIVCTRCPSCGSIVSETNGIVYCTNTRCDDAEQKLFEAFVKTLRIKGLGPRTIKNLRDDGAITNFVDIINLDIDTLVNRGSMSPKTAPSIVSNIKDATALPIYVLWSALGINRFSKTAAETLASKTSTLLTVTKEQLLEIPRVGDKLATTVVNWVDENEELLSALEDKFQNKVVTKRKGTLALTGKMPIPRVELASILDRMGWRIATTVSANIDILLYGKNPGSKLDRARELNITTIEYPIDESIENIL